jgi:hypothetical protein
MQSVYFYSIKLDDSTISQKDKYQDCNPLFTVYIIELKYLRRKPLWIIPSWHLLGRWSHCFLHCTLALKVKRAPEGNDLMKKNLARGSQRRERLPETAEHGVIIFFAVMFIILLVLALLGYLTIFVPFAFLTGWFLLRPFRFHRDENCYRGERAHGKCRASTASTPACAFSFSSGAVMGCCRWPWFA